jgi:autoinducer 2 (AI-2) kinase
MTPPTKYILTVDVGTGSGRSILFDLDGNQIAVAQREWLPKSDPRYPGALDFDTNEAWEALVSTIHEVMAKSGVPASSVAAVTATSMREGMVLYDQDKNVIWACPNVDARASEEVVEMTKQGFGKPIYNYGGDWLSIISPPRLWWIRKHQPELYERIAHLNMLSDWALFKFSGQLVTDPSIGSSSGIFDLRKRAWSDDICQLANLPRGIYADVYESGSIIGEVTRQAAEETGLAEGTPVVTSGGDTQLALVGVGAVKPGMYTLCGGTFWQATLVADKPLYDPEYRLRVGCHAVPGLWMPEGIGFYLGFTMRWFRDGFCQEEKRLAEQQGTDAYVLMEKLASEIPAGSNGVQAFFSYVMDVKCWRHAAPSFAGFNIVDAQKTGKAACIRAIEENAAYVTRPHFETLAELSGNPIQELTFAGGSSKGFLWPQIISDVMGVPVHIPKVKEATSLGSAICALMALGECKDWSEAVRRVVHWDRTVEPNPANHAIYDEAYPRWFKVYQHMLPIADEGLLPSLWRAPGV